MKARIALALLATAAPAAAGAQGVPRQGSVGLEGSVAGICILGPPSRTSVALGTLIDVSGPRTGRLAAIPAQQINLPGSWCNFAGTTIRVSASALVASDATTVQAGFARAVNFTSTVANWANPNAAVTTAASAGGAAPTAQASGGTLTQPKLADLTLTLSNFAVPSDALLVSSGYAGVVTITLAPAGAP